MGNPPLTLARSPTLGMSIFNTKTNTDVAKIAARVAGTT